MNSAHADEEEEEGGPSALHARWRVGGAGGGKGKTLSSRTDVYMTFVVSICHLLDQLLELSARLLATQEGGGHVSAVLRALLDPTALPLQVAELCTSLLQYDWADSRLQQEGTGVYTFSSKDISLFVHLALKYAPNPLEKVQFMVNDLFLGELKVSLMRLDMLNFSRYSSGYFSV